MYKRTEYDCINSHNLDESMYYSSILKVLELPAKKEIVACILLNRDEFNNQIFGNVETAIFCGNQGWPG